MDRRREEWSMGSLRPGESGMGIRYEMKKNIIWNFFSYVFQCPEKKYF